MVRAMKKLIDDVTIQEMKTLRENGMTNAQIARNLGVSPTTIVNYIGCQPDGLRAAYGSEAARVTTVEPKPEPTLKLIEVAYQGHTLRYFIRSGIVSFHKGEEQPVITLDAEGVKRTIKELTEILPMMGVMA